jgi:hypothetical protein
MRNLEIRSRNKFGLDLLHLFFATATLFSTHPDRQQRRSTEIL